MNTYLRTCLIAFVLVSICAQYVQAKEQLVSVPDAWKPKKVTDGTSYMNITGDYDLLGVGAPHMPPDFRGRPFYLDRITGCDIPFDDQKKVTHVHVDQKDCTELILIFFSKDGVLAKRSISVSEKVRISCTKESVNIVENSLETIGEAVSGTLDVDTSYYISGDGSLILHSKYVGMSHSFIFFWRNNEEYLVRFKKRSDAHE